MSDTSRHAAIRAVLAADLPLASLVTDTVDAVDVVKIRPGNLADTDWPPAIVVDVGGDAVVDDLDGVLSTGQARVQIACIAYTLAAAHHMAVEVQRVLHNFRGAAGGLTIDPAVFSSTTATVEPPTDDSTDDHPWHVVTLEFAVWYRT